MTARWSAEMLRMPAEPISAASAAQMPACTAVSHAAFHFSASKEASAASANSRHLASDWTAWDRGVALTSLSLAIGAPLFWARSRDHDPILADRLEQGWRYRVQRGGLV